MNYKKYTALSKTLNLQQAGHPIWTFLLLALRKMCWAKLK